MKRSFVCLQWSKVPYDQWLKIVLVNPRESITIVIPCRPPYIMYRAYFSDLGSDRVFDIIFPYKLWDNAMRCLGEQIGDLSGPIEFEFMKTKHSIKVQNWRYL